MKVYTTDRIRNVVVLGHGGSGKTSLVEALAYHGRHHQPPGQRGRRKYDQRF